MTRFDLVHDPWIPVTTGGASTEVSLQEALTGAHEIASLDLQDPLQTVAVFRQVLLPVVLDALGAPRTHQEWADRWATGRLDATRIAEYLAEHVDRFDLFHASSPFAQVAGLRTGKGETKAISVLLPAVATGNTVPLFGARTDGEPPLLRPAEAARAVLAAHCWDTAAIKSGAVGDPHLKAGKTTGNPTGPVGQLGVVIPMGATLAQTLLLNLPVLPQGLRPGDRPQWRTEPATPVWAIRAATGLMDLLTFQARRVRLIPQTDSDGVVGVSRVVLAAGDRLDHHPDFEPHTQWQQVKAPKAGDPARRPLRLQPGKAAWRGLDSLLATATPTQSGRSSSQLLDQLAELRMEGHVPASLPLQVLTVGVAYGNQSAIIEDVIVDLIPVPVLALTGDAPVRGLLLQVVAQAEALRHAGNDLGDDVRRAAGGDKLPWDKGLRVGDALVYRLTPTVHRLLAGLQHDPDRLEDAETAWEQTARTMALQSGEDTLSTAAPQTFLGRPAHNSTAMCRLSTAEARYRIAVYATLPRIPDLAPMGGHA